MKAIKRTIPLLTLLTLSMAGSCSDLNNPIEPPSSIGPNVLVPLNIGNTWTFRITDRAKDGTIELVDTIAYYIRGDTIVDGITWALEGYFGGSSGQVGHRNDSVGHHITNFQSFEYTLPYPAKTGDTIGIWIVLSTDSLVRTPIGDLHCYCYRSYVWFGYPWTMIYAPGIGPVYTEVLVLPWVGSPFVAQTLDLIDVTGPGMPPNKRLHPAPRQGAGVGSAIYDMFWSGLSN